LLEELLGDIVSEGFILKLLQFLLESIIPLNEVLLVLLDLALISFDIWVVLELAAELSG
jgi:hypothetical protein